MKLTTKTKTLVCILTLFLLTIFTFIHTINLRKSWYADLSFTENRHQWLTASTVKFAKNWLREGALTMKLAMFECPKSVETPEYKDRSFYPSYLPGAVIPAFVLSKLFPEKELVHLVKSYNLLNHFLIALILSFSIFFFLLKSLNFSHLSAILFAFIPILVELLMPSPLYWQFCVFFSDQAVMLPFALMIFLEVIRDSLLREEKDKRKVNILQALVFFYGILADWLMCFVGFVIYLKRVFNKEIATSFIRKSILFWSPMFIALILFIYQLSIFSGYEAIKHKFLERTGLNNGAKWYCSWLVEYWFGNMKYWYGEIGVYLLLCSLAIFIFGFILNIFIKHKDINNIICLVAMFILPCILQTYFFKNHTLVHDFSVLKFSIPIATVPFILIPILLTNLLRVLVKIGFDFVGLTKINLMLLASTTIMSIIAFVMLTFALFYLYKTHPKYADYFPLLPNYNFHVEKFIGKNVTYKDVVFSPYFEIHANPPHHLCYTMKLVYKYNSPRDILNKVKNINEDYIINIVIKEDQIKGDENFLNEIIFHSSSVFSSNDVKLYKIKKQDFLNIVNWFL